MSDDVPGDDVYAEFFKRDLVAFARKKGSGRCISCGTPYGGRVAQRNEMDLISILHGFCRFSCLEVAKAKGHKLKPLVLDDFVDPSDTN